MIIIGTGAGGGTLARHLAPSGKRILLLERGDWLPREPQNWLAESLRRQPLRLARHLVRREGQAVPAAGPLLRRRRDEALRRRALPPARGGLRRAPASRRHLARMADLVRRARALLHAGRAAYHVHGAAARIRPSRPRAPRTRTRPCRTSRGSSSWPTTSRRPATTRSTRPCGIMLDEANMPYSTCVRCATCDGFPCLVHAKSDAEVLGVRPALEHPNVTLLTNATASGSRPTPAGHAVTEVVVEHDGTRSAIAGDIVVVSVRRRQLGEAAARVRQRQAPERPGQRLGPGRPELHVPREPGRAGPLARREPDRLPEDARAQRLLLRRRRLRLPAREHPDGRQVAGADVPRREARETKLAPEWTLERIARHAIDFWLSTEDLPRPDNRVTVDRDGRLTLAYTPNEPRPKQRLLRQAQVDAREARHERGSPDPPVRVHEERDPGRRRARTRREPAASAPTRPTRSSTSTARPTSSTTSTSSTRASSRASAR